MVARRGGDRKHSARSSGTLVFILGAVTTLGFLSLTVAISGSVASPQVDHSSAQLSPQDDHSYCAANALTSGQLWTPVILLNSPYGGSSQGSSTTTTYTSYSFAYDNLGSFSSSTSSYVSSELSDSNGAASGFFQLDTWTIYSLHTVSEPGPGLNEVCTASESAEITETSSNIYTTYLVQPGTQSDVNELTSFSFNGYGSATFSNGYTSQTGTYYNCAPSSFSTGETDQTSVSASISLNGYAVSGTATMTSSATTSFTYNFPNSGTWHWQSLDGSATNGAWSFDYAGSSCSASPALDGSNVNRVASTTTISATLTTAHSPDLIIAFLAVGAIPNSGGGCSDNDHLTWNTREAITSSSGPAAWEFDAIASSPLSADVITCTFGSAGNADLVVFGVSGVSTSAPFDPHSGLPNYTFGDATSLSVSISTSHSYDLLIGLYTVYFPNTVTPGSGFVTIAYQDSNGPSILAEYVTESNAGTYTVSASEPNASDGSTLIADAIEP
jgi:hypothetical protein